VRLHFNIVSAQIDRRAAESSWHDAVGGDVDAIGLTNV
jgi:hypothetical protein